MRVLISSLSHSLVITIRPHYPQDVDEHVNDIIVQAHGSEHVILFIHLILGVFARHNQFGMVRQVKGKQGGAQKAVQSVVDGQKATGQNTRHLQELDEAQAQKDESGTGESGPPLGKVVVGVAIQNGVQ